MNSAKDSVQNNHASMDNNNSSKKLSFFPSENSEEESTDSHDSPTTPNDRKLGITEAKVDDGISIKTVRSHVHKSSKDINSDNDDASSTDSCSCEDHSSAGVHSDDDPHGDLDYDEDSITNSPSNDNHRSASLDDAAATAHPSSLDSSNNPVGTKQSKNHPTEDPDAPSSEDDDEGGNNYCSSKSSGNLERKHIKLRSFISVNLDENDGDTSKVTEKPSKDRSQKSYQGLLKYFFKDACYFQMKSINHENVEICKSMGVWSTPLPNEIRLNAAFQDHRNVILIFSVQQSGAFQGFARMISKAEPATRPLPWVLPERLARTNLGGIFRVEWLCTKELSFNQTRDLYNPLNDNKPIKVARDGQQVESRIGRKLCALFPRDSKKQLLDSIETLKSQSRERKQNSQKNNRVYPLNDPRGYANNHSQPVVSPHLYPPYMNGYPIRFPAADGLVNHPYENKLHQPSYALYGDPVRNRLGSSRRRNIMTEHQRAVIGQHDRHQNYFINQSSSRPNTYSISGPSLAATRHGSESAHHRLDSTHPGNTHDLMHSDHIHHYAPPPPPPMNGLHNTYIHHPHYPQHPYQENHWVVGSEVDGVRYHPYYRPPRR